jgi:hypothetical protein
VDVGYQELLTDPMAVVARVYDRLGLSLSREAEARMGDFIAANPQGKAGRHAHDLQGYGLTQEAVRERVAEYTAAFGHLI